MEKLVNTRIVLATKNDTDELLALYRSHLYGAADWDEYYPNEETIEFDLARDSLFVMKNEEGEIIACISIDEDQEVENLPCWNKEYVPAGELSRLAVKTGYEGQGIARQMMRHTFGVLKDRGMKMVHILVKTGHEVALASYTPLGFEKVGECTLFGKDFVCMEHKL